MGTRHHATVGGRTGSHRHCGTTLAGTARRQLTARAALAVVSAIAASLALTSAARASGGEVVSWGNNKFGQLGDGLAGGANSTDKPVFACPPLWSGSVPCKDAPGEHLEGVTAISAGGDHSLALLSSGEVVAWGDGAEGALGDGSTSKSDVPVYVCAPTGACPGSHLEEVIAISAGNELSNIALLKGGRVVTWGSNEYGQLGDGSATPTPGYSLRPVYVCAASVPFPEQCETGTYKGQYLTNVSAVSAAPAHTAAILEPGGELLTWGVNNRGQLGQGDWSIYTNIPKHVCEVEYTYTIPQSADNILPHCSAGHYLTGVELIAFGDRHNIAQFSGAYCIKVKIKEGGHSPEEGERCRSRDGEPAQEAPEEKGKKGKKEKEKGHGGSGKTWEEEGYEWIEEHANHAVVSFGNNEEGQLGDGLAVTEFPALWPAHTGGPASCEGGTPCSEVPIHVCKPTFAVEHNPCSFPEYLEPVAAIAAGGDHSLALNASGEVLSWGENKEGEEGDGRNTAPNECSFTGDPCIAVPEIVIPGGITALAGGLGHELALKSTGEVLAWGRGASGQLGDDTTLEAVSPQLVCAVGGCGGGPLTGVTAVSAAKTHSVALGTFPSPGVVWSQKGKELPKGGPHVAVKTSGSLTLDTEAGPITCKVKDVEEIWNPATGNGEDLITTFVLSCKSKLCPAKQKTEVNALGLPWPTHLTSGSPTRDEIEKIDLEIRCSISGLLDEYKGTLAPEVGNSVLTFGPGSGELEDSLHHKATLVGTDKLSGKTTA